jgi:hypothetical protein
MNIDSRFSWYTVIVKDKMEIFHIEIFDCFCNFYFHYQILSVTTKIINIAYWT